VVFHTEGCDAYGVLGFSAAPILKKGVPIILLQVVWVLGLTVMIVQLGDKLVGRLYHRLTIGLIQLIVALKLLALICGWPRKKRKLIAALSELCTVLKRLISLL
jgi:hypothetical protein